MPAIEVRALTGKAWGPQSCKGDVWKDPDEAGDTVPQNSDELFLLVEEASPSPVGAVFPPGD